MTIRNDKIGQKCKACGHDTFIPKAIHKITTFIINHPPDGLTIATHTNASTTSKRDKASKGEKRSKKQGHSKSPPNEAEIASRDNDEDQWDDDELTTDAYSERMRELCEGLSNGNIMRDAKESANILFNLVKSKKAAGLLQDQMVQKEIVKEAERLDIRDKSVLIMSEILFSENIIDEIKANKILLLR